MVRLPPASRIDRFEIKSLIGSGGMGTLYLARDTSPNTYRLVALKLLNTNLDSDDLRDRFAREARALASLSHPNVVNIYECGEFRGSPYIVMEYVRGETLAEKIKRKAPLSLSEKLKLMMELCAGLAHAHEAGIIHRDIKPANMMVDHHGRLRLLDFGIARVVEAGVTMAGVQMTQINMRIGTPGYMSPEQYEGAEIDRRSDIFAVGAVFYELLAYREAFPGSTTRQIEKRVLESEPERLTSQIPDLDSEIEAVVAKALQKDPDKRFQDASQMERALTKVWWRLGLAESSHSTARPTPPPPPGAGRKSSRADAAYQRALAALSDGAPEAARRYAMEALAEDAKHEGARRYLATHDPNFRLPAPSPPPPPPLAEEDLEPTIVSTRSELNIPVIDAEQTIVSTPVRRRSTPSNKRSGPPSRPRSRSAPTAPFASIWKTYGLAITIVGALLLVGGAALIVMLWRGSPGGDTGELLTISRPANGTIVGDGINCGTRGADCTERVSAEGTVSLQLVPDEGYAASGYTDDCAPIGRVRMSGPRTCGATFVRIPESTAPVPAGARHTLTIYATEGGVVRVGSDDCRETRAGCSHPQPAGQMVDLEAQADRGFTFERFTGACDVDGRVLMDGPKTCGASFVRNSGPGVVTRNQPPIQTPPPSTVKKSPPVTGEKPGLSKTPNVAPPPPPSTSAQPNPTNAATGNPPGTGEGVPPAPPGTEGGVGPAPPPPPPVVAPEVQARNEITAVLERYRLANETLKLDEIRKVHPTVHPGVAEQFRGIESLRYQYMGEPKFIDLQLGKGRAVLEVPTRRISELRGGSKRPIETIATITLTKVNAENRWLISNIIHRRPE
jgi:serine/threonine protein kinase